jgi:N-methylhydantoinase A
MATRIGVDVGGTFTDLIFFDDAAHTIAVGKVPTTPDSPEEGVLNAVSATVSAELVEASQYFLHGTTVGLNALLERRGAVVGLLTTRGFRDVLEIRRGDREDMYDVVWSPTPPLVPRHLSLPVTERITSGGEVHTALYRADIQEAVATFEREGVTAVAVAFINAYANPAHELAAEQALREYGFSGDISLSHRVSGEYREYERTSTTAIDAFVRRRMGTYLQDLDNGLRLAGFDGTSLLTRAGGGAMTFNEATERPFETIMSGPVAGAEGAAHLARTLDLEHVICADVGGTSFDTCLITAGRPHVLYEGRINGMPIQAPWVDVRSIGAGGGSIAAIDRGGLLTVGPRSAGSTPGPPCYGRGGTEPTVTDAAFVLGMLGHGHLASGMTLNRAKSLGALAPLAEELEMSVEAVARGVMTIASASMANAIREVTVEQGQDPREAALVAFGGAGPLFATLLADELDIRTIVVPPYAGNFSAWGLLGSDLTQTASRTRVVGLCAEAIAEVNALLVGLFSDLDARVDDDDPVGTRRREVGLDMRYAGQEHTLTVDVASTDGHVDQTPQALEEAFVARFSQTFGHVMDQRVEIVNVRATLRTPLPQRHHGSIVTAAVPGTPAEPIIGYSFTLNADVTFDVVHRASLAAGARLHGPAIVIEETTTTYLDAGFVAELHPSGSLIISRGGDG